MSALKWIKRHKLLVAISVIIIIVIIGFGLLKSGGREILVASKSLPISANQDSMDTFTYTGSSVNQSMQTGCSVPASMKLYAQNVTSTGSVDIYLNNQLYASGTISDEGEVMLSSGCGCSTVCICEIKIGDNTIKIASQGFEGQVKYEIYVKS